MIATPSTSSSSDEIPKLTDEDQFMNSSSETCCLGGDSVGPLAAVFDKVKVPGKRLEEPMECIVCRRPFKNPNALDKHLKFVHTVSTDGSRPMYKKYAQEARMKQSLTNNTTPIKPSIAKALASKLSQKKKNCLDEAAAAAAAAAAAGASSEVPTVVPSQQNDTIIIFEVTELTEDNMYGTNSLLNGPTAVPQQHSDVVETAAFSASDYTNLQPSIVCNGTTETNMIVPHPGTSEVLVDVPQMIVIKKSRRGEPSAFRASSEEILNLDNGVIVRKEEPAAAVVGSSYNCDDCKKTFAKKYQLKRHQETHDSIFYTCPYCDKAPLKARSSLKKHFTREHADRIHEWSTANFLSKQILRDEDKLRELRKKYHDKKRLNGDKLVEAIHRAMQHAADESTSNSTQSGDSFDSLADDLADSNGNTLQNGFNGTPQKRTAPVTGPTRKTLQVVKKFKTKPARNGEPADYQVLHHHNNNNNHHHHHHRAVAASQDEMIDNLFDNLINDNLLDPLNGNEYDAEDDQMNSVNYIQETFQNSFKEIQEKLDADLEVGSEQLKWEDNLKSDDSTDEIMSGKLLDENVMLI